LLPQTPVLAGGVSDPACVCREQRLISA